MNEAEDSRGNFTATYGAAAPGCFEYSRPPSDRSQSFHLRVAYWHVLALAFAHPQPRPSALRAEVVFIAPYMSTARLSYLRAAFTTLLCLALLAVGLLMLGMSNHLDHDEHQFIASAAMLARRGLLPYRDYPYFHMPNLIFVYAVLFRMSDHLLLAARAFSIVCGAATAGVLATMVYRACQGLEPRMRRNAAFLAGGALIAQPLFARTSGRAWNHDLPVLLTLLAFGAILRARTQARPGWLQLASGALVGLAIGTRLTFAPAALAFLVILAASPPGKKIAGLVRFSLGAVIALLPTWWLLAIAPRQFIFGNFLYPALNTRYHREAGFEKAMTVGGKAAYVVTDVLAHPATLLLFILFVVALTVVWRRRGDSPHPQRFAVGSLLLLIACLLVGTFAPTPLFLVYFYAPVPFAILLIAFAAADGRPLTRRPVLSCIAVAMIGIGLFAHQGVRHPSQLARWAPLEVHRVGEEVRDICPPGPVLTLSPIFPLEGGRDIYRQLVASPFVIRAGARMDEGDEELYHLMDEQDWPELFDLHPPSGVLTGLERNLDVELSGLARARCYDENRTMCLGHGLLIQTRPPACK